MVVGGRGTVAPPALVSRFSPDMADFHYDPGINPDYSVFLGFVVWVFFVFLPIFLPIYRPFVGVIRDMFLMLVSLDTTVTVILCNLKRKQFRVYFMFSLFFFLTHV